MDRITWEECERGEHASVQDAGTTREAVKMEDRGHCRGTGRSKGTRRYQGYRSFEKGEGEKCQILSKTH